MALKGSKFDLNNKVDDFFEEESKKEYKYCTECRTKVLSDAKFCFNCGSKKFIDNLDNISDLKFKEIEEGYKNEYEKISSKINNAIKELEDLKNINKAYKKKYDDLDLYWKDKIKQIKDEKIITSSKANSLSDSSNGYIKKIE